MSSPTNVVVIITHVPSVATIRELAMEHRGRIVPDEAPKGEGRGTSLYHAKAALWQFFTEAEGSWRDGSEGAMLAWGTVGNHVSEDEFMAGFLQFMADLIERETYSCATVTFQSHDSKSIVHQVSRVFGQIADQVAELWLCTESRWTTTAKRWSPAGTSSMAPLSLDVDIDRMEKPGKPAARRGLIS